MIFIAYNFAKNSKNNNVPTSNSRQKEQYWLDDDSSHIKSQTQQNIKSSQNNINHKS
jgi:hypothetical protein